MIKFIKFLFIFLFNVIINNPFKVILIVISLISLFSIPHFPDGAVYKEIVHGPISHNGSFFYAVESNDGLSLDKYDDFVPIENGKIKVSSSPGMQILCWILFGSSTLVFIILSIISTVEDDVRWDFEELWDRSVGSLVLCEFEDGKYYYTIYSRMIHISEKPILGYRNIGDRIDINLFNLSSYPKFVSKQRNRESLISKLVN